MNMGSKLSIVAVGIVAIIGAIPIFCQAPVGTKPSFEVATVKPAEPGQRGISGISMQPGGRLVIKNMPLRNILIFAYNVRDFQVAGGPSWMAGEFWDIEARAEAGIIPTGPRDPSKPNLLAIRLQSLLADRFQLKTHTETRELPVYELSIAKGGLKMKLSDDQTPIKPREPGESPPSLFQPGGPMRRGTIFLGRGNLRAAAMNVTDIVQSLSSLVGRIIVDKTGLTGLYDVKLQWTPDPAPAGIAGAVVLGPGGPEAAPPIDSNGPSIFTALQEQLGLRLDSAKGPVDVIVVDSVQKPSEN
jgi:bla regulator protein blaR1